MKHGMKIGKEKPTRYFNWLNVLNTSLRERKNLSSELLYHLNAHSVVNK